MRVDYLNAVISGLKRIAIVQERNPWVAISATISAGIWIYYQGHRRWLLNPSQSYLRVENAAKSQIDLPSIEPALQDGLRDGSISDAQKQEFRQWRVTLLGLNSVWSFFEGLDTPPVALIDQQLQSHPRYFPGALRELVLTQFDSDGRVCRGVEGLTKPHKVAPEDRIEFDHILPYSRGGASDERNIQVICHACNRQKRATAL